jgi:hypothetical protein
MVSLPSPPWMTSCLGVPTITSLRGVPAIVARSPTHVAASAFAAPLRNVKTQTVATISIRTKKPFLRVGRRNLSHSLDANKGAILTPVQLQVSDHDVLVREAKGEP